jgi:transcriptional regulator with XRE-family HTH domain
VSALENLRTNLKRLRLARGWTQQQLAEHAGVDYKYLQRIEAGHWPGLRLKTIKVLAAAVGFEAWQLLHPSSSDGASKRPPKRSRRADQSRASLPAPEHLPLAAEP